MCMQVDAQEPAGPLTFFPLLAKRFAGFLAFQHSLYCLLGTLTGDIPHTLETYITHIHAQSSYNATVQI